ncbi:hypothetical protein KOR34_45240 [Posidoniimonas corsicana]|uniref:Uncharacterized protein n=1 Tax=Posidoniimonas corsicana TaxID=1938618 RepID=A0A5C5UYA3_9BACT|nr:hypothetical protein [Posidoniimonas corsicana]TWT31148.1 hypothetical protein KOR34_45240 [Posidoniimonas corsicana]
MSKIAIDTALVRSIVAVDCGETRLPPDYQQAAEQFICDQLRRRRGFGVEQADIDRLQQLGLSDDDARRQAVVESLGAEWSAANGGWPIVARGLW